MEASTVVFEQNIVKCAIPIISTALCRCIVDTVKFMHNRSNFPNVM